MLINTNGEDRANAVEFAERMHYTFTHLQGDVQFNLDFAKSVGEQPMDTVLLDPQGRVLYHTYMENRAAGQRMARVVKLMHAHEEAKLTPAISTETK